MKQRKVGRPQATAVSKADVSTVRRRPRLPNRRRLIATASAIIVPASLLVQVAGLTPTNAAVAPVGQGFTITATDLSFILAQIKIAERHAATQTPLEPCSTLVGTAPDQIPSPLVSKGLRTVDGSCNNLQPGQERFGSADQVFPRIAAKSFRAGEDGTQFGSPGQTFYRNPGDVVDSEPRVVSNLIVDQTSTNPAAIAAAGFPVRSQGNPGVVSCSVPPATDDPVDCVPAGKTLFMPNVTTDVGLSPPYNSLFTLFGQFFDHGVDQTVKSGGTVFVPLKEDDPLRTVGPDHEAGTGDEVPANQAFMVLTRAKNVAGPGPDGVLGTGDDVEDAKNTDSPWVDQSQTYTSHPSHQVFLREYSADPGPDGILDNDPATAANEAADNGVPVTTGKLLGGLPKDGSYPGSPDGRDGISTWASTKKQAAERLGFRLQDIDAVDIPMIAVDPYGNFLPGPARGLPQYVTPTGMVEGNLAAPVAVPGNVVHIDTPFITDIAHNADPSAKFDTNGDHIPDTLPTPDADNTPSADFANQPARTYDDELLNSHFACGDGRCNENIGLTTIHQVFHSEHDRLVDNIKATLLANPTLQASYKATHVFGANETDISFGLGGRLFQAARFVTEMEYQHLVFEEFARKVQPGINPFEPFAFTQTEINPAVKAEFAHAVYRFGHSMLTDTISRLNEDGSPNDISLLDGFLNPPAYFNGGPAGTLTPKEAAGSIVMGMADQAGNELDEFVTETLRNNLLGLPLDLATVNMARARSEGVPSLNNFRRDVFHATNDGAMAPYTSWVDFGEHLKHPESLVNFVAAYGQHPTILAATNVVDKREAARLIVNPDTLAGETGPTDANAFMNATASDITDWSKEPTGLDSVALWVGGPAEVPNVFGGLLGSTFNFVFETQLTALQNGDRLYYLARTPGMNLRTQLEGNSFSELIMRNTNAHSLKADPFATADCKFELKNLNGTPDGFSRFGNIVADDPASECNEKLVLLRKPDGTIQYRNRNTVDPSGINGQSVYNGTAGVDRVAGGNDSDTLWGGLGNDKLEGGDGADVALGGVGDDIITDLNGDDVPKGGPGDDAIDAGPGLDIIMGGEGKDFTNGGANANETFGGDGDDFIMLGESLDAAFGDSGDDYEEGGNQPDLMQGDSGNLFFLDDSQAPGSDILVGQGGDDDYDMEGGDDIGVGGPGIEKVAGASGYDWEIGIGDPQRTDMDLAIGLIPLDILTVGVRDKFNEVESLSGGDLNDILRGDDIVPAEVGGGGFIGCDVLDQAGLNRINGLDPLVPPLTTPLAGVVALSASNDCPILSGPVWGAGNILLGGGGSDLIEGRGADDIIDGDKYLNARLSVRTNPADPASEIGSATVNKVGQSPMTQQYLRTSTGALTGPTLQKAVFAGTVDPGNIVAVREIVSPATTAGNVDTVVFSGPQSNYSIVRSADGDHITVTQTGANVVGQKVSDGIDTVRNVENLRFCATRDAAGVCTQLTNLTVAPPPAPANLQAVAGNTTATRGTATVTWNALPAATNGFEFQVKSPGLATTTVPLPFGTVRRVVTGLVPGRTYTFAVRGLNDFGTGPFSESNPIVATGVPGQTGAPTAVRGNGQVSLNWSAGVANGSPVTDYLVTIRNVSTGTTTTQRTGSTATNTVVTGLTNGQVYNFRISAINVIGTGAASGASANVTPATTPNAPVLRDATSGNAGGQVTATANWNLVTGVANNGGSAVTSYTVKAIQVDSANNPTGVTVVVPPVGAGVSTRNFVFAAAQNNTRWQFEVFATNGVGNSPTAVSNIVTAQ